MGAESSVLQDCEIGDLVHHFDSENWDLHDTVSVDSQELSIFSFKKKDQNEIDLLQLNCQFLKTLRHPNILHYVSSGKGPEGSYLLTERVVPLQLVLSSLSSHEVIAGLNDLLEALIFLHEKVKVSHNNVCVSSLFVSEEGQWKLGSFEHASLFKDTSTAFLKSHLKFRNEEAISPEELDNQYTCTEETGHLRDVFAFGVLADNLLELMGNLGDATKTFEVIVQDECMNSDPSRRPCLTSVKENKIFRNDFIEIRVFLKEIAIKGTQEKQEFFRSLLPRLIGLPEKLVARRLVKLLLSRFVLLDETAVSYMVPHLLTPCREKKRPTVCKKGETTPVFTVPTFRSFILPEIFKIFHVHDSYIRIVLLKMFREYVDLFEKNTLQSTILPQILLGLADTNDQLVAESMRALADIVPILGGQAVLGGQRKAIFSQGTPKHETTNANIQTGISVNKILGKQNKILLNDLATGRFSSSNGDIQRSSNIGSYSDDPEAEVKRLEKERKREEARLRREERRQQMKERRAQQGEINQQENRIVKGWDDKEDNVISERVPQGETTEVSNERPDDEWEDWENLSDKNNLQMEPSEDSISDEIENELKSMPTTVSPKSPKKFESQSTVTSPKDRFKNSDDEADWSREISPKIESERKTKRNTVKKFNEGQLKLAVGGCKNRTRMKSESENSDISADWNAQNKQDGSIFKAKAKKSGGKLSAPKINPNQPLGAEFDIMGIQIKKRTTLVEAEPDFFADMMPEISTKPSTTDRADSSPPTQKSTHSPAKTNPLSFSMKDDLVEAEEGWGEDDLDWGGDF